MKVDVHVHTIHMTVHFYKNQTVVIEYYSKNNYNYMYMYTCTYMYCIYAVHTCTCIYMQYIYVHVLYTNTCL